MKKVLFVFLVFTTVFVSNVSCSNTAPQPNDIATNPPKDASKTDYEYEIIDGAITILSHQYNPEETEVIVPEKIDEASVAALGENAFYQHENTISITLPASLEQIEGSSFYRCYSLEQSFIPRNVKNINGNPYFRCSSLESITVDAQNQYFSDDNGVLFNKDKTILIAYPEGKTGESYTIPSTVTKIECDAFGYLAQIKELYILSNVVEFPYYNMFAYAQSIKLYIEPDSAAEKYAKEFGLNYEIISEE